MNLKFYPADRKVLEFGNRSPRTSKTRSAVAVDCDADSWAIMPVNPTGEGFECLLVRGRAARRPISGWRTRSDDTAMTAWSGCRLTIRTREPGCVSIGTSFLHPDARGGVANRDEIADVGARLRLWCSACPIPRSIHATGAARQQSPNLAPSGKCLTPDRITWTGYIRDTVVFSILDHECRNLKGESRRE